MRKTKQISITLSGEALQYLEELCAKSCRTRSAMIGWILLREKAIEDKLLDEEARDYDKDNRTI